MMRVTILFFLITSILALSIWALHVSPKISNPFLARYKHKLSREQFENIRAMKYAPAKPIELHDEFMENERGVLRMQYFLLLIILLAVVALIIGFLEIAARGKRYEIKS